MTANRSKTAGNLEKGTPMKLAEVVSYVAGSIVSRELISTKGGTITLFAFDKGQGLSEHSAPFDAFVQVIDGRAMITIGGNSFTVQTGEAIVMPANIPHAVSALEKFKMLLVMIQA